MSTIESKTQIREIGKKSEARSPKEYTPIPHRQERSNIMKPIQRPAICIEQRGLKIFPTFLKASELQNCTCVDHWNPKLTATDPNQGYQRGPEPPRVRKFGNFMMGGIDSICPTALLLSDRNATTKYDQSTNQITINTDKPLHIVDGQHRVAGFGYAIVDKKCDELREFQVPVIIVKGLDRTREMQQFRIVNGTAKSVRTDLCNMILTKLEADRGEDAISEKDFWKIVCVRTIEVLNTMEDSPWKSRILMPNEKKYTKADIQKDLRKAHLRIVRATSFITSLRPVYMYLKEYGHISGSSLEQANNLASILKEYWSALKSMMPEAFERPGDYVIQKTPGLFALHMICQRVLGRMHTGRREWKEAEFKVMLEPCPELSDPNYWLAKKREGESLGAAAYGSMKGFKELADSLDEPLKA
jgi:DGQHR domain-containing protein